MQISSRKVVDADFSDDFLVQILNQDAAGVNFVLKILTKRCDVDFRFCTKSNMHHENDANCLRSDLRRIYMAKESKEPNISIMKTTCFSMQWCRSDKIRCCTMLV